MFGLRQKSFKALTATMTADLLLLSQQKIVDLALYIWETYPIQTFIIGTIIFILGPILNASFFELLFGIVRDEGHKLKKKEKSVQEDVVVVLHTYPRPSKDGLGLPFLVSFLFHFLYRWHLPSGHIMTGVLWEGNRVEFTWT
jgi:hypothetical protein